MGLNNTFLTSPYDLWSSQQLPKALIRPSCVSWWKCIYREPFQRKFVSVHAGHSYIVAKLSTRWPIRFSVAYRQIKKSCNGLQDPFQVALGDVSLAVIYIKSCTTHLWISWPAGPLPCPAPGSQPSAWEKVSNVTWWAELTRWCGFV